MLELLFWPNMFEGKNVYDAAEVVDRSVIQLRYWPRGGERRNLGV